MSLPNIIVVADTDNTPLALINEEFDCLKGIYEEINDDPIKKEDLMYYAWAKPSVIYSSMY